MPNARNARAPDECRRITAYETKNVCAVAAVGGSSRSRRHSEEGRLTKDDLSEDQRAALAQSAKSALVESAATEVVSVGSALFKDGEPSDPELQRRYLLYKRLEAVLALPAGPQRLEALHKAYRELQGKLGASACSRSRQSAAAGNSAGTNCTVCPNIRYTQKALV
jgi:regulator of protease activity HflC (stomatin/prohibitin superfamily)